MPVKDVDAGLIWQNYNPRMFRDRLPADQSVSKPFFFGGSQIPTDLGLSKSQYSGSGMTCSACRLKSVKKLPNIRK
jgi:hypothetical protein